MNLIYKRRTQRGIDIMCWPFKIAGLTKLLGILLTLAAFGSVVQAANVTLAWNQSADPNVAGYNIYYGGASGNYTNQMSVGLATDTDISGLLVGATYYFAATTYSVLGMESALSGELSYTVPTPRQGVQIRALPAGQFAVTVAGAPGHTYDILASQDLMTWTVIGTVTLGATGALEFTDTNATGFSRRFYRTRG